MNLAYISISVSPFANLPDIEKAKYYAQAESETRGSLFELPERAQHEPSAEELPRLKYITYYN
jgi:hypothetical protein